MKKRFAFVIVLSGLFMIRLSAQEFKTDISIKDQLKNNQQPGMQYAPATDQRQAPVKTGNGSSLVKQIKDGKMGMPVSTSSPGHSAAATTTAVNKKLASDQSPAERKVTITPPANHQVPAQEEKTTAEKPVMHQ